MIINLKNVTAIITRLGRSTFGSHFPEQNISRKLVSDDRQYLGNHAGGMYALLVSSDISHRH